MIPLESIRAIVDYDWSVEERDYEEQHPDDREGHVFEHLRVVDGWLERDSGLDAIVRDAMAATLRQRGANLAADRLELLDADEAWAAWFGPVLDTIQTALG